jgi:hypothetical protein
MSRTRANTPLLYEWVTTKWNFYCVKEMSLVQEPETLWLSWNINSKEVKILVFCRLNWLRGACTDKKEKEKFLKYRESLMGSGASHTVY